MTADLDILFVADARLVGGTSTALASEIRAAEKAGFVSGLLHVRGPLIQRLRPFHPGIRAAIDRGAVNWIDPQQTVRCRLVIVHHPMLFPAIVRQGLRVRADHAVIVAHHPPSNGLGELEYDIRQQVEVVAEVFDRRPAVAPVGPNVRQRFKSVPHEGVELLSEDWHNLIDLDEWPAKPFKRFGDPIVIGRHSRPSDLKWPDTREEILAAYPVSSEFAVRVLGSAPFIADRLGFVPANWQLLPFGSTEVRAFLTGLDAFVYFHSVKWVEAFGRNILEALATGLVTILPPHFRETFEDAAIYAEPEQVRDLLFDLRNDVSTAEAQGKRARNAVEGRFSDKQLGARLAAAFGLVPRAATSPICGLHSSRPERSPRIVLFVSTNGIGLGHLTRQLAVAKRLNARVRSVFFTMSGAARLVRKAGYLVEHSPSHRYSQLPSDRWNEGFAEEILEAMIFHRPSVVVFDGPVPYPGLMNALSAASEIRKLWIRRAMWRKTHQRNLLPTSSFDLVIEPGEIAGTDDFGPTRIEQEKVHLVDPVLMIRPEERVSKDEAHRTLGIESGKLVVAMQLGAGNNFNFAPIRHVLLAALTQMECTILEFVSPATDPAKRLKSIGPNHRILDAFPSFKFSRGFDFAVSAAGYNSFHENILGGVPTLFVPNEAEEMDLQIVRAEYAERRGLARVIRAWDVYSAAEAVAEFTSDQMREDMRLRCSRVSAGDGALEIARLIEETIYAAEVCDVPSFATS